MTSKSADYWQGYREQQIRSAAKEGRSAVDAMPDLASISREVAKNLGRDQSRKQRIFQRSPHVFVAMDAEAVAQASSRELAMRELQALGIDCGDNDPVAILDAHHAGANMRAIASPLAVGRRVWTARSIPSSIDTSRNRADGIRRSRNHTGGSGNSGPP